MALRELAPPLHRLPPILHMLSQNPIVSCSKGPRGLSVLARESRILTATTTSPGPSRRQRPSHYAIHARQNLPDKELRYLRTVIVTAALHRGFGSKLHQTPCGIWLTHPLNLPAAGTRRSLYLLFRSLQRPVFLVNSCQALFAVAPSRFGGEPLHANGAPLLPKLRGDFAEFLLDGSPEHLRIFSPPTCVGFGTVTQRPPHEAFLGSVSNCIVTKTDLTHIQSFFAADLPTATPDAGNGGYQRSASPTGCVPPWFNGLRVAQEY